MFGMRTAYCGNRGSATSEWECLPSGMLSLCNVRGKVGYRRPVLSIRRLSTRVQERLRRSKVTRR